jgi:hypothetical protein
VSGREDGVGINENTTTEVGAALRQADNEREVSSGGRSATHDLDGGVGGESRGHGDAGKGQSGSEERHLGSHLDSWLNEESLIGSLVRE